MSASTHDPSTPDFLKAYEDHVWDVYGYLAYRADSRSEAEDLTQVTFEQALRSWNAFDPKRASAKTWLLAIARNALTDYWRRRRTAEPLDGVPGVKVPTEAGPEEDLGLEPEIQGALSRLSRRDRSVLALRFGGDLRASEIADVLDLSVANVQQILSRAVRRLRTELERQSRSTSTD